MNISDRIKKIRTDHSPKLSQTEFGERLGVSKDVIANLEYDRVKPSDSMIRLICMTYKVNPVWLETGEGEPYDTYSPDLAQEMRDLLRGSSPFVVSVMTSLVQMPPEWWESFQDVLFAELEKQKKSGRG